MITVIGLGTGRGDLTLRGRDVLKEADEVLVRIAATSARTLDDEGIAYTTLDFLYEKSRNYDTLVKNIVSEVRRRAKGRKVCYCMDGSAGEDAAARVLLQGGAALIDGNSKAAYFAARAGTDGDFTARSAFRLQEEELSLPLVVYDLTRDNVSDVKLFLAERFGDEAPAALIDGETVTRLPLYELDRKEFGEFAGMVVDRQPLLEKKRFSFEDFLSVMRRLRAPDGCPWDRAQTHESIRINAIEEAYELVDAIDLDDPSKICEEAGDVLMQSVFHALIEEERGNFTVGDMLTELCEKLITRHTHVFGQDKAAGAEGALSVWEKNKMTEKHQAAFSDAVNDVPQCFPALLRAQKIAKRAGKGGWDLSREELERVLKAEYGALTAAYERGDEAAVREKFGAVLLGMAWLGRTIGVDGEMALLDAVKTLQKRYTAFEALVRADGKDPNELSDEARKTYYERANDDTRA